MVLVLSVSKRVITAAWVGLGGEVLERRPFPDRSSAVTPMALQATIVDLVRGIAAEWPVCAVGIALPGAVRRADGHVHDSPELSWKDVPLGKSLSGALALPVQVVKPLAAAAAAELVRGAGQGVSDLVYLAGAAELGAGVVTNGSVLSGASGYFGQFGHIVVDPSGPSCICGGRGCWSNELSRLAREALGLGSAAGDEAIRTALARLSREGDVGVEAELEEFGLCLANGLVTVAQVFAPEVFVLGGLLGLLPRQVLADVSELVAQRWAKRRWVTPPRVVSSALGDDVYLLGAAEQAFDSVWGLL